MSRELPDGWRWVKLAEVCQINPRRPRNLAISPETDVTFIPMAAVSDQSAAITGAISRPYTEVSRGYTYMEDGDVIFAKITPCMQNGKHAIVRDTRAGFAFGSTEFHVLRPSDVLDARLLHSFLLRPEFLQEAERSFTGTAGQQRVPKEFMASVSFPLPPIGEQHCIIARLEEQLATTERARSAALAQLAAIEAMPQALLRQIFPRSPARELLTGWRWAKLGDMCEIVNGSTPKSAVPEYWGGDICWVTPTDLGQLDTRSIKRTERSITIAGYNSCSTTLVPAGAVVMSSRAPIGHLAIAATELCTNQGCKAFVPTSAVESKYLYYTLRNSMDDIRALGVGATFAEVSKRTLAAFTIPLPPIDEQRRIVRELDEQTAAIERARAAAQARLDALEDLPAAALRLAFTP